MIRTALAIGVMALTFSTPVTAREYRRILRAIPFNLDPQHLEDIDAQNVMAQIAEGLVTTDRGQIVPALAEHWEFSPNLRQITFHLRSDARFSDGVPILAEDVVATLRHTLGADSIVWRDLSAIVGAEAFHNGKVKVLPGVRAMDSRTVRLMVTKPYIPLLDILASPIYAVHPAKSLDSFVPGTVVPWPTSGPFTIAKVEPGKAIHLKRNEHYYHKSATRIDAIRYDIVPDEAVARARFFAGEYDDVWPTSFASVDAKELTRFEKIPAFTAFTWYLQFNLNRSVVKNPALRRLLRQGVDRAAFLAAQGLPEHYLAKTLIPRGLLGYHSEPRPVPVETQASLLQNSGCSKAKPCVVRLIFSQDLERELRILLGPLAPMVSSLRFELIRLPRKEWYDRFVKGDYDIAYLGNNPSFYETSLFLRYLLNDAYHRGLERTEIRRSMDRAIETADRDVRRRIYADIDDIVTMQDAVIPIYHGDTPFRYVKPGYTGHEIPIVGYAHMKLMNLTPIDADVPK